LRQVQYWFVKARSPYRGASHALASSRTPSLAEAIPLVKRAIELDPNFAEAYAWLAGDYFNLGETSLALENTKKAYELRERLSGSEKLSIESQHYYFVTGDLEKAREAYEVWAQSYPRSDAARNNLGLVYEALGQYDKNLTEMRESLRLVPKDPVSYSKPGERLSVSEPSG